MVEFMRDLEVDFEGIGFESDKYAEEEYSNLAESIPRQVRGLAEGFKRVYVPLDPSIPEHSFEDIDHKAIAEGDTDTLYLFIGEFQGEAPEDLLVVYTKAEGETPTQRGYIYENQVYIAAPKDVASFSAWIKENEPVTLARFKELLKEQTRKAIFTMFVGDSEKRKRALERDIARDEEKLQDKRNYLRSLQAQIRSRKYELYGLQMFKQDQEAEVTKVMEAVTRMTESSTKLKSVNFGEGTVIFNTGRICIEDDFGGVHPIGGSMQVKVNPESVSMSIFNKESYLDEAYAQEVGIPKDIQHPHVDGCGDPCLGNASEMLAEACEAKDIEAIWQIALSYLESYNSDDVWGMRLAAYPVEEGGLSDDLTYTICTRCGNLIGTAEAVKRCKDCDAALCERCYESYEGLCDSCSEDNEECDYDE